jgi:hypothetical protein
MNKTAVQIDLVYVEDETQKMRIHAIVANGKLASSEMYCHLMEWNGEKNELQPGILNDEEGLFCRYKGEWGYGDESDVTFEFLDRPLDVDQQVIRTDIASSERHVYTYRIVAITDLLQ